MIYTLEKIQDYTRSLDKRTETNGEYNDTWINERIEEGMAIANEARPIFFANEIYDLEMSFKPVEEGGSGLEAVEIILQEEPHAILKFDFDTDYFTYDLTPNNHIIVSINNPGRTVDTYEFAIKYSFYPTLPFTTIEMSMEMWRLVKEGIAISVFEWLRNEELVNYHTSKLENKVTKGTFDIEKNLLETPDTRLGDGTWA